MSNYWRKKLNELNEESETTDNYWQNKMSELEKENAKKDDIAPVRQDTETKKDERKWFQKGAFEDGYQFGDLFKTLSSSGQDLEENIMAGILGMGEKAVDVGAYIVGGVGGLFSEDFKESAKEFAAKDLYDEKAVAKKIVGARNISSLWTDTENDSVFGEKSDDLAQSGGQLLGTMALQSVGVPWFVTSGITSFGSEVENAFNQGATYEQAGLSAAITAGAEILTEKISGGIKFGGSALDDVLTKKIATGVSNRVVRTAAKLGMDVVGEGGEEVLSGLMGAIGQKITYADDKELSELFSKEDALEAFIGGAALGGTSSGFSAVNNAVHHRDATTGLTKNEEMVFKKVYDDAIADAEKGGKKLTTKQKNELYDNVMESLKRGEISTDTIESLFGGEDYKAYKSILEQESPLREELRNIENNDTLTDEQKATLKQSVEEKLQKLANDTNKAQVRSKLDDVMKGQLVRQVGKNTQTDDYLLESYNEDARRKQAFEVDLSKYEGKTKEILKNLMDKKQVNNTRVAHEFWEYAAKSVAERGGNLMSATTDEILEMARKKYGNEYVDKKFKGKTPNAFVLDDGTIAINVKSPQSRRFLLGHEITHTMEKAGNYDKLAKLLLEYDKNKTSEADQKNAQKDTEDLYDGIIGAEADKEYIADLVGKYIYDDVDFIHHLSTKDQNLFQKIFDWVKHQYKMATAGSKEQRDLLRIKREFEKAYRENIKSENKANGKTDYSLSIKHTDGTVEELADARDLTNERAIDYLNQAKSGILRRDTYIPVRKDTPQVIIDTLEQVNEEIGNYSLVMQVKKARGAMATENPGGRSDIHGNNVRAHNLSPEEIVDIVNKLDEPTEIIYQTNRKDKNGKSLPNNVAVFVEYGAEGNESVAVIEFESSIDPEFIGEEFGDTSYHTVVTVFEPDVIRDGMEFDYVEELLSNPDNIELEIKRRQSAGSATGEKHPNTSSKLPSDKIITQNSKKSSGSGKFSLSSDSDGKQLTKEQTDFFKDSKMRDDNGNLKVMYHGSQDAGFHVFDSSMSDDDTSFFFVDRNDVAASYSGTTETYEAQSIRTAEDMNNFIEKIGAEGYEVVEENGKFTLLYEGDRVADSKTAKGIYEEFCWYEGVGEGDANYKVYLNLTNPLEIDAEGRNWDNVTREFSQEVADKYNSLTAEEKEALVQLAAWEDYSIFKSEIKDRVFEWAKSDATGGETQDAALVSAYKKLGGKDADFSAMFSIASDNFSAESIQEFAVKQMNTRDYAQKAKAEGYDGVIFKNIHDNGGYSNGSEGASTVAIAFNSNQIKSVANEKPTGDPDIRFSLSKSVEETKDLVALHNVRADKLMDAFKLGGLPSPSVAITKSDILHDNYGDITLLLRKDAIDPQADSRNKVYGSDAWTPTISNARTEYEVDSKKARAFEERLAELSRRVAGGAFVRESVVRGMGIDDFSDQDAKRLSERLANYDEVRAAYLADNGKNVEPEYKTKEYSKFGNAALQKYIDRVGAQRIASMVADSYTGDATSIQAEEEAVKQIIRDAYIEKHAYALNKRPDLKDIRVNLYMDKNVNAFTVEDFIKDAWEFYQDGGAVTEEIDRLATSDKLRSAVNDADVRAWLEPQIAEFLGEPGIYNGKDLFYSDGRRRSFAETHYTYTAENIVKAMQNAPARGSGTFGAHATSLIATATPSYQSIAEMHADKGRLKVEDQATYDNILRDIDAVLESVEHDIMRTTKHHADNTFEEEQIIGSIITEAATGKRTVEAVQRAFAKDGYRISTDQAKKILALYDQAAKVPTGYFEAKPERVVGFDEVAAFIIPNNADVKLKQELLNRGYAIAEYDPSVEGSRQKVVNSFEEYKFSLSNVGEAPVRLKGDGAMSDTYLAPTQEDVAPVAEDIAENATTTPTVSNMEQVEDYAPITEEEANALQSESIASLTDEDAPPEVEASYYAERGAIALDGTAEKQIIDNVNAVLYLDAEDTARMKETIQKYAQNPDITEGELYEQIRRNFHFVEEFEATDSGDALQLAKKHMRGTKIYVPEDLKGDFNGRRKDGFNQFRKEHMGHFYLTTNEATSALGIDQVYAELNELFPELFPDDIMNPADQLQMMGDVANTTPQKIVHEGEYDDDTIQEVCNIIRNGVDQYSQSETARLGEEARNSIFASDDFAPVAEVAEETPAEDVTPTATFETAKKGQIKGQQTMFEEAANSTKKEQPIKTIKDRLTHKLHVAYGELSHNKRLRRESLEGFNSKIDALQLEYDSKKNKDTKVANDILRRIERLKRMRDEVDADYTKRINDNRARVENYKAKVEEGYDDAEGRVMRKELHQKIIDGIKAKFTEKGKDLDEVLKNAKDLSTFATVDNTPQRVMEKSLGYKEGQTLADETVNKVAQNETEGIKWLNSFTDRKSGFLAKISEQYNIKPGSKESAAAQMYAEGFYVNDNGDAIKYGDAELAKDFPDVQTQANIKGLAGDQRIRQIYDDTLKAINESRARNAYPEIPRLDNYFLHFRAMEDTFSRLGLPFNPNDIRAKDLPTDLNGVTADLKPGQPYFASAMHRNGQRTSHDLLGGLERYLSSAKNQIYHIDDIQTLRALRNYVADTYGQAKGLEGLDALTEEEAQERIKQVYGAHLSTFAKFLNEEANILAGKTSLMDRGLEGIIGRRGITFLDTVNKQVGSNMVGFNASSSLTNFIPVFQAFAKTNKTAFVKGFAQTISNRLGSLSGNNDGFAENSPVMIRRKGADRFARTPFQKVADAGYTFMGAVDSISTEIIARAKYNELTAKGMSSEQAHIETDKWVSRLMGDRSLGQMPQLYNSKMLGLVTKFQLEVRNQLDSQFYDTIQEAKVSTEDIKNEQARNAKTAAKVASTFVQLAVAQHVFGQVFESIAGYNPTFDIIEALIKTLGLDDEEEEDTVLDNIEEGFLSLVEDLPYTSVFMDGGRIPISSALPIGELITGEDEYGNDKSRLETLGEIAPYYVLPGGYGQLKKSVQGLSMFSDEHPIAGSYTDSGNLRFPVDDTLGSRVQAGIFGQWASKNARNYFDNERKPLTEKQIQEFMGSGLSIDDYWGYRDGLKGRDTLAEKADYISGLDFPISTKNQFINNIANRKEDIDLTDYDDYGSFEEFDYAENSPEMYSFLKENGISYWEYKGYDEDTKRAWTWAYKNPEKYSVSKAVSDDFIKFYDYKKALNDLEADKDDDGKSISGSKKEKVINYINNNLNDLDYGQKIILYRSMYNSKDDRNAYNKDIVDYLNSRNDISYEEMETILKELGFNVDSKGNITWD